MPRLQTVFAQGLMDKETSPEYIEQGRHRHAENFRFSTDGGTNGKATNPRGNKLVSDFTGDLTIDINNPIKYKAVGAYYNENLNKIYYLLATSNQVVSKVCEYDVVTGNSEIIAHDNQSILKLQYDGYITGIDEIDGLLFWSEFGNNPRRLNIERAKTYGLNGFTEEDIMVIVKPPLDKPKITLGDTEEPSDTRENNIEEKMLSFAYRYRYLDGEYSALSPFSEAAFFPEDFKYDYSEQSNISMLNKFNKIDVEFNTGGKNVVEIQLVLKDAKSNSEWIVDDYNKGALELGDNEPMTVELVNNKIYRALSDNVLRKYYDNVPHTAKGQAIIDGRLLYGHYIENYDLIDAEGNKITMDYNLDLIVTKNEKDNPNKVVENFSATVTHIPQLDGNYLALVNDGSFSWLDFDFIDGLVITLLGGNSGDYEFVSATGTTLGLNKIELPNPSFDGSTGTALSWSFDAKIPTSEPKKTAKSNRDYEVGIVYTDGHGRSSTVLVSKENTLHIPAKNSTTKNQIRVTLNHKPPVWATHYRFFIKQNKTEYDQLLPIQFYEDGVFRWVKLEGADKDKIKEGDWLVVKSDTNSIKQNLVRTKVLEVKEQPKNFLQADDVVDTIKEKAGLYFKVKPDGYRFNLEDYDFYELNTYHNSRRSYQNNIQGTEAYIGEAYFYGDGNGELTSSGTSTLGNNESKRFLIEIESPATTFRWSDDNGANWTSGITITTDPIAISDGLTITFASATGHITGDYWSIFTRGTIVTSDKNAYVFFNFIGGEDGLTMTEQNLTREDEQITTGTLVTIRYDEYNRGDIYFEISEPSSRDYANIQEWYYGENIGSKILQQEPNFRIEHITFARGILDTFNNANILIDEEDGFMTMIIKSQKTQNFTKWVKAKGTTEIYRNRRGVGILLETEGQDAPPELYYEIGKTYPIENGAHKADLDLFPTDQHQEEPSVVVDSANPDPLIVTLDWFNAFSYGNAVESYKIRDEFNEKGLDVGIRTLTTTKEGFKQELREADICWSDVYEDEFNFNGLSSFSLPDINFVKLDKEEGSIQKLINDNGNLLIFQEKAIGLMPYNKNILQDVQGNETVGIATNILDRRSYRPYAEGRYGCKNPESIVVFGNRKYFIDRESGLLIRLSNNGITPISFYGLDYYFSNNSDSLKHYIGGYDPKRQEYLITINEADSKAKTTTKTLAFKEKLNGFPNLYSFNPELMIYANKDLYSWKDGKMYKHDANPIRNNFYGVQYKSSIKYFVNQEFSVDKIWKAMKLHANKPCRVIIKTDLTSRTIEKTAFDKKESFFFTEILGNTNNNLRANSVFGLGNFQIVNGQIFTTIPFPSLSVGDFILGQNIQPNMVTAILPDRIVLANQTNVGTAIIKPYLVYRKNQNIDGSSIRGNILEVDLIFDDTDKVELTSTEFEVIKSNYS